MTDTKQNRILLVDDIKADINLLIKYLGENYEIEYAMDGESALERALTWQPDLILLDILMPGIDGYEVCRVLKDSEKTKDIPIIFLTSKTKEEDEKKGFSLGAVDYITKPFSFSIVQARVHTHLKIKKLIDELQSALCEIKTLQGILPVCCYCGVVRDDSGVEYGKGTWKKMDQYITEKTSAEVSHSCCPECYLKAMKGED